MRLASRDSSRWPRSVAVIILSAGALSSLPSAALAQRVLGLDVSAWQSNISQTTWNNIRNVENRQFVFIRSSRGGTTGYYNQSNPGNDNPPGQNTLSQRYDDPYFIQNITRATNAGMFAGPYHFSRPDVIESTLNSGGIANSGTDEANHFMQMAGPWMRPGYLLPVHDFEAGDGIRTDNEMARFAIDFSDRIYDVMGIRPAIYVSGNYANYVLGGASQSLRNEVVAKHPTLWSARWPNQDNPNAIPIQTGHPGDSISWVYGPWDDYGVTHPWAFWQYTSRGRLPSFNNGGSNLDLNVAQGNIEFLKDHLVPALWMNDSSGQWTELANWNSGQTPVAPVQGPGQVARVGSLTLPTPRLPGTNDTARNVFGSNDTVILDRPSANITVTHSAGAHSVRKLIVRETLSIAGGSLSVGYDPASWQSPLKPNWFSHGPSETINVSAQFSGNVSLSGTGRLSVHTLRVDAARDFSLSGGTLEFNRINLMPHSTSPAEVHVTGTVDLNPLNNAAAVIANGTGSGSSGQVMLSQDSNSVLNVGDGLAAVDVAINVPVVGAGLTKTGPGTLALNGVNNYNGDTVVEQGKLSVSSPNGLNQQFDNEWDIHLSSGAILDLNFSGTPDMIGALFIDGVSQKAGIWGAEDSGAPFTTELISGSGRLEVTRFVPPPGDFNGDGHVDAADYVAWRKMDGSAAGYGTWQAMFGSQPPSGSGATNLGNSTSVPEPANVAILLAAIIGFVLRRRTKQAVAI